MTGDKKDGDNDRLLMRDRCSFIVKNCSRHYTVDVYMHEVQ